MGVPVFYQGSKYKPSKLVTIPIPVAPQFSSAEIGNVNASTVAVTFDSAVVASGDDYSSGVTIKVNGSARSFESGIRQTNHAVVYYALALAVVNGNTVTWEYAKASGNIVAESGGMALEDVTAQTVTNNVAPSGPVLLLDLEADTDVTTDVAPFSGTGIITQAGDVITGIGTNFTAEIVIGDRITSASIDGIVISFDIGEVIQIDTTATVAVGESFTITPQSGTARVADWSDAQGNHFTQSGIIRPSLQTLSGKKAVVFDGTGDSLVGPINVADNLASFTIFSACDNHPFLGGSNNLPFISKMSSISSGAGWQLYQAGFNVLTQEDGGSVYYEQDYATTQDFNKHIYTWEFVSRNLFNFYIDGVLQVPATITDSGPVIDMSTIEPIRLNIDGSIGDGVGAARDYYAVRIYSGNFDSTDRAAIEAELAARYGVTL